ncbi:MFS transporter [Phytohalomonas tamaricis]|uniref:MFS transporter n=1 Tax=Phytohalomonas tamaricis TaxID=2081032 RepID=UPI000D0B2965|nr:MFS transporter [Phytohalomonas tamaricis]
MKLSLLLATERRAISGLALLYAFRMLGLFMVLPVLSLYAGHLEYATPALIGIALGGYGLTQALLQIPFGLLSDRIGRKVVIAGGLLLFLIGSIVAAEATTIYGVIAGRCLQGSGAIAGAIMALLADRTREEVRTTAMATIGMSIGIAFAIAMVVGPLIAHTLGLAGVFWATAALAMIGLLVLWRFVPAAPLRRHRDVGLNREQLRTTLVHPNLLRLDFSILSLHMLLTACFVAVPVKLVALGIAPEDHGWVYLAVMGCGFVTMIPMIIAAEKYRHMKMIFTATVGTLAVILFSMSLLPSNSWMLVILLGLFFVAFNFLEATLPSMISKLAPAGAKGTAMSIYSTSQFLGASIGGAGGGMIAGFYGENAVFLFASCIALLWLLVIWRMPAPRHLSSEIIALNEDAIKTSDVLVERFAAIAGVEDVLIVPEERVAYLKVDRTLLDTEALAQITERKGMAMSAPSTSF